MPGSHYRLERTSVIDHAGTTSELVFVTTSRARLVAALREALSGHFVQDSIDFAWDETLTRGHNAISELFLPSLLVLDGDGATRLEVVPDMTVARGGQRLQLEVVRPGAVHPQVRCVGADGSTRTFSALSAVGDDEALLKPLREAAGEVSVSLHLERLQAAIPELRAARLAGALPFRPWFDAEDFAAFVREELEPELLECLPSGAGWDGMIPQERWFPAGDLLRAFGDAGYDAPDEW